MTIADTMITIYKQDATAAMKRAFKSYEQNDDIMGRASAMRATVLFEMARNVETGNITKSVRNDYKMYKRMGRIK